MFDEQSFALLKDSQGNLIYGKGPFTRSPEPLNEGISFYLNDFTLTSDTPWLIPSEFEYLDSNKLANLTPSNVKGFEWSNPSMELFTEQFHKIEESMRFNGLLKTVPVTVSTSKLDDLDLIFPEIVKRGINTASPSHFYAYRESKLGFAGLSPEILFEINNNKLRTMALAGTAHENNFDDFLNDKKEHIEHQIVVESLRRRLSEFGPILESQRKTINLGGIIHFLTEFEVELTNVNSISYILKQIHPTPAIGTVPRNENTLKSLSHFRNQANSPPMFAAPFGVKVNDNFISYIMIRGLFFENDTISLPSGCGITENSVLNSEWDELALKRQWVKDTFGLNL